MPSSKYKGRGKILRYRTIKLNKKEYLKCGVVSKKGKRGGKTICTKKKYKK